MYSVFPQSEKQKDLHKYINNMTDPNNPERLKELRKMF